MDWYNKMNFKKDFTLKNQIIPTYKYVIIKLKFQYNRVLPNAIFSYNFISINCRNAQQDSKNKKPSY